MPEASTAIVEAVGMSLVALYHVIIIIVLVNMLIAMMSHSFERIQEDTDVEWKFARTRLWLTYMDDYSILPGEIPRTSTLLLSLSSISFCVAFSVPFNMLPTPRMFHDFYYWVRHDMCPKEYDENSNHTRQRSTFVKVSLRKTQRK